MKYSILLLVLMLFISGFAFAAAPTVTLVDWSPGYSADLNYAKWDSSDLNLNYLVVMDGVDLDTYNEIFYTVTGAEDTNDDGWQAIIGEQIAVDHDTNIITLILNLTGVTEDVNFGFKITDGDDANSVPVYQLLWLDETAPTTAGSHPGQSNVLRIYGSDNATTTGDGSGLKGAWMSVNNGDWEFVAFTSEYLLTTPFGPTNVKWYGMDNLDNNEMYGGDYWEKSWTSTGVTNSACGLVSVLLMTLVAAFIISLLVLAQGVAAGEINMAAVTAAGITAITFFVILILSGTFQGVMCAI
jgi:hypothetical protein